MKTPHRTTPPRKRVASRPRETQWIGGRVPVPFYITEGTPYRPEITIWLELPADMVVFYRLHHPTEGPVPFGDTLRQAMETPMVGPPRTPRSVRVADASLAAEIGRACPGIPVVEAPTPELQRFVEEMAAATAAHEDVERPSYFEGGRIGAEAIEAFFVAAQTLYRVAPWKSVGDDLFLRVDIPDCEVRGGCLSIVGALGQNIGWVLFPSYSGLQRFIAATEAEPSPGRPVDLGTTALALCYEAGSDLPPAMYREVLDNGWPVADARAYPVLHHRDRDGLPRPLTSRDIRISSMLSASLASFCVKHSRSLERGRSTDPVCESWFGADDIEVRFTVPYEAGVLFDVNLARLRPPDMTRWLQRKIVPRMARYAAKRFGTAWPLPALKPFRPADDPDSAGLEPLVWAWAFFGCAFERKTLVQWFLEGQAGKVSRPDRIWLEAQDAAWLSVWEFQTAVPGRSLTLRDLLTGETREVPEPAEFGSAQRRGALLARVVDHQGASTLAGVHSQGLSCDEAAGVVQQMRARLRRKGVVSADRLRKEASGACLIRYWEEAVEKRSLRAAPSPDSPSPGGDGPPPRGNPAGPR